MLATQGAATVARQNGVSASKLLSCTIRQFDRLDVECLVAAPTFALLNAFNTRLTFHSRRDY